jgi:hypothetical protein
MNTQKLSLGILLLSGGMVLFFSCKKQEIPSEPASDQFKNVVDQWRSMQSTIISTNSSESKKRKDIESILNQLDYTVAKTVRKDNSTELYFIKINSAKPRTGRFLCLQVSGGKTAFDGVYESSDINKIVRFYSTKKLAPKDSLLVWDVDNVPMKGWCTDAGGKRWQSIGLWKPKPVSEKVVKVDGNATAKNIVKVNLALAPPPTDGICIDWYWTWYDPETGIVVAEQYIGSTGNCTGNGGGGPGNGPSAAEICQQQVEQQLDAFRAGSEAGEALDYTGIASLSGPEDPTTGEKPWSADWTCYRNAFFGYELRSHETGELRPSGWTEKPWCFKKVTHQNITFIGSQPVGTNVTFSQGIAIWSVSEQALLTNIYYGIGLELKFNVTNTFIGKCEVLTGVVGIAVPPTSKDHTSHAVWAL